MHPYTPWTQKTTPKAWFRGNANSAFIYPGWNWRAAQRFRLSDFVQPIRPGVGNTPDSLREEFGMEGSEAGWTDGGDEEGESERGRGDGNEEVDLQAGESVR